MNEEYVGGSRRSSSESCLLWLKAVHLVGLWIDISITGWNLALRLADTVGEARSRPQ